MSFRIWLNDATAADFSDGALPDFLLRLMPDDVFLESEDLKRQGYRLITGKFPPHVGQKVWWKAGYPVIPANDPQPPPRPNVAPKAAPPAWVLATVVGDHPSLRPGQRVALSKRDGGDWDVVDQMGRGTVLGQDEVATVVKASRDAAGKPVRGNSPRDVLGVESGPDLTGVKAQAGVKAPPEKTIPPGKMSEEQKAIERHFAEALASPGQSHIMISALAGSGKTTMLKHLAWKFGSPQQKWLYLVFGTKNKVEAKEKFPPFVKVETTNGFLGRVLDEVNKTTFHPTERIVNLNKHSWGAAPQRDSGSLEKARLLVEGPAFSSVLREMRLLPHPSDFAQYQSLSKTLVSLFKMIQYQFKEQVLTLAGLAKSFAVDPRQPSQMREGIEKILASYDFDTVLENVKERINGYRGTYRRSVLNAMYEYLGYDFMSKGYRDEIVRSAEWLLLETMPRATSQTHKAGGLTHNLADFRDFNDDLWFTAVHSDEIKWPHYDVVLADEVQDFNETQKIMLRKLHDAGAKIVAVGDENQAIYRFRGADSNAFRNLNAMLGELSGGRDIQHHLTKNFRSRKAIIDFSNQATHVNNLEQGKFFDDGDDGIVTNKEVKYDDAFAGLAAENKSGGMMNTAFIARTNEPLVHAALKMLNQKIPFVIVGKDLAQDLKKHIAKVTGRFGLGDQAPVGDLRAKLEEHLEGEKDSHFGNSTKKVYLEGLSETTKAIVSCVEQFQGEAGYDPYNQNPYNAPPKEDPTIGEFKDWLGQRLGGLDVAESERDLMTYREKLEKENPVILTSAHRAKGLEFHRVFILRDDQFPHPKAKRPEDMAQEENTRYVAYTRAMDQLHILDLKGQPGVKDK